MRTVAPWCRDASNSPVDRRRGEGRAGFRSASTVMACRMREMVSMHAPTVSDAAAWDASLTTPYQLGCEEEGGEGREGTG